MERREELERKAEVAELLLEAAHRLGESLEPARVYDRFHELLGDVIRVDGVVVSSYDEAARLIRCDYAWVEGNRLDPSLLPPLPLNAEGGMQSRVIVTGEPLLVNDVGERVRGEGTYYNVDREGSVRKVPDSGPAGTQAAMMVPVKHEGAVVGVVQVMSDLGKYTPEQLEVVTGLVGQLAAAVRLARLRQERTRLEAAEAAARAVAEEREQAANVLDAVGDGIFLAAPDGVVRFWNRAAEHVTGVRADEAHGRAVPEVFPGWEALAERIDVAENGAAARAATLPVTVGVRDLWLSFVAVRGADGIVYAFRDVTSERRLEEEKSDFVATISHELRTPMASVYGAAETLIRRRAQLDAAQQLALLEMIASQSSRLRHIVEEVLLVAKLDRDEVVVGREPVDVVDLVRATVDAMRAQLPPAAEVALDVPPEPARAAADADRIQQVLINLIDNAAKYGAGTPIAVGVEPVDGVVRISVADGGPGIAADEQERIFEKFYRTDPQLRQSPGGTGLGLYIARELVRRMDGRIDVRSEPGAGATFVVELPRA